MYVNLYVNVLNWNYLKLCKLVLREGNNSKWNDQNFFDILLINDGSCSPKNVHTCSC